MKKSTQSAWLTWDEHQHVLTLGGDWTYHSLNPILEHLTKILTQIQQAVTIDMQAITHFDTSGGWIFANFLKRIDTQQQPYQLLQCQPKHQQLLALIMQHMRERPTVNAQVKPANHPDNVSHSVSASTLYRIGKLTYTKWQTVIDFLSFIGLMFSRLLTVCRHPRYFRGAYIATVMQQCGVAALPLIAFLSLLVGVVLAYQLGLQLRLYGANVFVVNLLSMSVLREFGPLITAILVAGRSGSAFTAQIATMVVRQEVDALRTLGLSPIDFLVLPRVLALMIMMPLVTVWAECFALLGGMIMSKSMLGISFYEFLQRARVDISLTTYFIGLIKTPVFGLVIAAVGCFQGLQVSGSAASVGQQTTKSVVQALFLIIILDALFSIIFSIHGF